MPFQFNINLDLEIERLLGDIEKLVPSSVIDELRKLDIEEAKSALSLAEKYRQVDVEESGDMGIKEAAQRFDAAVVTNDQELIEILRKSSVPVIRMRGRQHLDFA